jgi:hypothetical protein
MAVIEGTEGPLLDDRLYHLPQFSERAEAYHRRVLSAHQRHAKVDVPLPSLNGQVVAVATVGDGEAQGDGDRQAASGS